MKHFTTLNTSMFLLLKWIQAIDLIPRFYVRKTWSYRCEIPFLVKEVWHKIEDHGLVNVDMSYKCEITMGHITAGDDPLFSSGEEM